MKKVLSIALALVMLFTLCSQYTFAMTSNDYVVTMSATTSGESLTNIKAGDVINVSIKVNTTDSVDNLTLNVKYDNSLFSCDNMTFDSRSGAIKSYGGISQAWYDSYFGLADYQRPTTNNESFSAVSSTGSITLSGFAQTPICWVLNDDGSYSYDYPEDAITDLELLSFNLTALSDITEETTVYLRNGSALGARVDDSDGNGYYTYSQYLDYDLSSNNPHLVLGGASTPSTPEPTAAPAFVDVTTTNNLTTEDIAAKSFVAFASVANYTLTDDDEFGILIGTDAESVKASDDVAVALGSLDNAFSIKVENGGDPVAQGEEYLDYFDKESIGYVLYLKGNGFTIYSDFIKLK